MNAENVGPLINPLPWRINFFKLLHKYAMDFDAPASMWALHSPFAATYLGLL